MNHDQMLELFDLLEYSHSGGICHGFTLKWAESVLLVQQSRLYLRMSFIDTLGTDGDVIKLKIDQMRAKKGIYLSPDDKLIIEMLAFFENIVVYQQAHHLRELFGTPGNPSQLDFVSSSKFAGSHATESTGLKSIGSLPLVISKEELFFFLNSLESLLQNYNKISTLILSDKDHTMGIGYDPALKSWFVMNVNSYQAHADYNEAVLAKNLILNVEMIIEEVFLGFSTQNSGFSAFHLSIVVAAINPVDQIFEQGLKELEKRTLTKSMLSRSVEQTGIPFMAAEHNDYRLLAQCDVDDLTLRDTSERAPISVATYNGNAESVNELLQLGVPVDLIYTDGRTLAHIAASRSHTHILPLLRSYGFDFNVLNAQGETPAFTAAFYNHVEFLIQLHEYGADLNTPNVFKRTPFHVIAKRGYEQTVRFFCKVGISPDVCLPDGRTPLFTAAHYGQSAIVKLLLEYNADITKVMLSSAPELLFMANRTKDNKVVERMQSFIDKCKNPGFIHVSPYKIALIMGYPEVARLIKPPYIRVRISAPRQLSTPIIKNGPPIKVNNKSKSLLTSHGMFRDDKRERETELMDERDEKKIKNSVGE